MLERFGHIIPWILVAVLGLLALAILMRYRSLLQPIYYYEEFQDAPPSDETTASDPPPTTSEPPPTTSEPPPPSDPTARAQAINTMKATSTGKAAQTPAEKQKEINEYILTNMTNMVNMYKTLPDAINNSLNQVIDITDDTCYIVKLIESKYTKKPLDEDVDEKDGKSSKISHKTKTRERKFTLQKTQFMSENKGPKGEPAELLECFSDISGADISGAPQDISGAPQDISGAKPNSSKAKPDISGAKQDISGATPKSLTNVGTVPVKDLSGAAIEKKLVSMKAKLLQEQAKVQAVINNEQFKTAMAKLKKVPLTAKFGSQFITKNTLALTEGYQNPKYKFPMPYKDSELNAKQKDYLQTLQAAQNLLMDLMKDLGVGLAAFISYDKLLKDYRTIDPSYAP